MDRGARIDSVIQILGWSEMIGKIFDKTVILFSVLRRLFVQL